MFNRKINYDITNGKLGQQMPTRAKLHVLERIIMHILLDFPSYILSSPFHSLI